MKGSAARRCRAWNLEQSHRVEISKSSASVVTMPRRLASDVGQFVDDGFCPVTAIPVAIKVLYTAHATAVGARNGHIQSSDALDS